MNLERAESAGSEAGRQDDKRREDRVGSPDDPLPDPSPLTSLRSYADARHLISSLEIVSWPLRVMSLLSVTLLIVTGMARTVPSQ